MQGASIVMQCGTCRLVRLGQAIEALERPKAAARMLAGKPSVPGNRGSDIGRTRSDGYTRDIAAVAVGMSGATYERAKAVVMAAPERKNAPRPAWERGAGAFSDTLAGLRPP